MTLQAPANVRAAKTTLRQAALERRAAVPEEVRARFAEKLALDGVALARRAIVRTVAIYWPMRGEADTRFLAEALHYHEFVVALPVVERLGAPLAFRKWTPRDPLVEGLFGTREPPLRLPEVTPDMVFVPFAAFDRRGCRLGYGGGFYDLTLGRLRGMKRILAIGVGFAAQEVPCVPDEAHDERLDLVMTEDELIACGTE
jgi:5-formyltetrahydrofolate cyclo-ligase